MFWNSIIFKLKNYSDLSCFLPSSYSSVWSQWCYVSVEKESLHCCVYYHLARVCILQAMILYCINFNYTYTHPECQEFHQTTRCYNPETAIFILAAMRTSNPPSQFQVFVHIQTKAESRISSGLCVKYCINSALYL
jgi:hypothetical protein